MKFEILIFKSAPVFPPKKLFFLFTLLISTNVWAVDFDGKFIQGHFILGNTLPNSQIWIDNKKVKVTKDGYLTSGLVEFRMQGGAFGGSPVSEALQCAFASYNMPAVHHIRYDILENRPRAAA